VGRELGGHRDSLYFAVIGTHVRGKSASPAMHKASFKALGIDAEYIALDVPREELPASCSWPGLTSGGSTSPYLTRRRS